MNKTVVYVILLLAAIGFVNSQPYLTTSPNTSIIVVPINGPHSDTIKLNSAYFADSYIVSRLGQGYYDQYINLSGGSYYGNISHVYFSYSIPFINGSQSASLAGDRRLGITITLNGSNVIDYIGPAEPYILKVNSSLAIKTAKSYGMLNDTARLVGLFGQNTTHASNYSVAWAVISHDAQKGQNYYGIYVDAVIGNVIGEFYYLPYDLHNSTAQGYGTMGNFSLFILTPLAQANGHISKYIYYTIFAMTAVAAIIAWIMFKPKKKSKFTSVLSGASS